MATNNYQGPEQRKREPVGWHLKKEVNLTLIISVIGIAVTCVIGYTDLKRDIALIQADLVNTRVKTNELSTVDDRNMLVVSGQYQRLEAKLDRLIEREHK
jgi:hypothetical protein